MIRERIRNNIAAELVCVLWLVAGSWADAAFNDPVIPHGERIVYDLYIGDEKSMHEDRVRVKDEDGDKVYEFTSKTKERDLRLLVTATTMVAIFIEVVLRDSNATVDRTVSLVERKRRLARDEIGLLDIYSLGYLLRGYPFGKQSVVKLQVLGQESALPLQVEQLSGGTVTVNGKEYSCHHLTVSMPGMLGKFLPKAHYWYLANKPHYLVKFEGPASGPGSPKKRLELATYDVQWIQDTADTAKMGTSEEAKGDGTVKESKVGRDRTEKDDDTEDSHDASKAGTAKIVKVKKKPDGAKQAKSADDSVNAAKSTAAKDAAGTRDIKAAR
ncbi:MAG: hypothetical protein JW768_00435 [Chitinispirillaceae bacterium]|nr:hypothetical protein [Chitinispirillaceae bacterium]